MAVVSHSLGLIFILFLEFLACNGDAEFLSRSNMEQFKAGKKLMLINFYADWCRYSAALKPVYDKAADQVAAETNEAVLVKVDCERDRIFCMQDFRITKYPTIKIIRNGELIRKEYRGQRTVEALVSFVKKQIESPVHFVSNYAAALEKVEGNTKAAIGFFATNESIEYQNFNKIAFSLKDECRFFAIISSDTSAPQLTFREQSGSTDQQFNGDMTSHQAVQSWLSEHCIPLVREITFQNGEELTEEGLPFFILFYHPDNPDIKAVFKRRVEEELLRHKGSVNFVTADGIKFAHPLSHLGKSKKDLPVLAIDSFRHMYIFPNFNDIHVPGALNQFVEDLHSGKLHREFHHGPDPRQPPKEEQKRDSGDTQQPPESTFKKLKPANSRYSFVDHDEL
ncbi:PREDICTED: endoplasmic reticulum resident protein 44-like isoform X2 [Amphimedon queenslandica]|uniref:Thioredoxin domain-containing protein n=1 Tax=Amphimedon queenslandica TaxID=400682 RepID=A0A1X7U923_AMPQE|nr:PREDICTED: endoplasmic reticulum resident protein 44-like isoform X2 [Amphimedon queenslandica]|eukprot:XP_019855522.1 PREDICTED: endoplasmic reticulum resident protein 44-like isoform X2 [Amphimedon queenslandica]